MFTFDLTTSDQLIKPGCPTHIKLNVMLTIITCSLWQLRYNPKGQRHNFNPTTDMI